MANPTLQVDIIARIESFNAAMQTVRGKLNDLGKTIATAGAGLSAGLTLPLLGAGAAAVKYASDTEESLNKVRVAFGNSARTVESFAETTVDSFGIARSTSLDMAALFGDMATSMGLSQGEAAKMSTTLVGLAGDLASFKNIQIDIASTALKSIFTGETESLKELGVVMTQANLEAFALSQGLEEPLKTMSESEKVMLRYQYVLAKTSNAHGDFARTGGGAANQMRMFQESLKEVGAQFGEIMLPIVTDAVTRLNEFLGVVRNLAPEVQKRLLIVGAALASLGPLLIGLGAALKIAAYASDGLGKSALLLAKAFTKVLIPLAPVLLKIAAIVAIVGALFVAMDYLSRNATAFAALFVNAWNGIKRSVLQAISSMAGGISDFLANVPGMGAVSTFFGDVSSKLEGTAAAIEDVAQPAFMSMGEYTQALGKDLAALKDKAADALAGLLGFGAAAEEAIPARAERPKVAQAQIEHTTPDIIERVSNAPQFDPQSLVVFSFLDQLRNAVQENELAVEHYAQRFTDGFARMVVEGEKLRDVLRQVAKQLLSKGLSALLQAVLIGGTGPLGTALGGAGGKGILGKLFPKFFGAATAGSLFGGVGAAQSPFVGASPVSGAQMQLAGEFRLAGQDLKLVIDRANRVAGV